MYRLKSRDRSPRLPLHSNRATDLRPRSVESPIVHPRAEALRFPTQASSPLEAIVSDPYRRSLMRKRLLRERKTSFRRPTATLGSNRSSMRGTRAIRPPGSSNPLRALLKRRTPSRSNRACKTRSIARYLSADCLTICLMKNSSRTLFNTATSKTAPY